MDHKYNEEEYGKLIYEQGFQSQFYKYELVVLVKYLKNLGKKRKEITSEVYKFCEKWIPGYSKVKFFKVIDSAINNGLKKNNKLIVIKKIDLYKCEIDYIDGLEIDHEYKKLLLSFLFKKKISREISKIINGEVGTSIYFRGSRRRYKEVFDCANIVGKYKVNDMINDLVRKGILVSPKDNKGNIVLSFIGKIKYTDEIFKEVKDFSNIGYIFDVYKGENRIKNCECCGKFIKTRNNKTKYCKECAKEKQLNWQKESMKKIRNVK